MPETPLVAIVMAMEAEAAPLRGALGAVAVESPAWAAALPARAARATWDGVDVVFVTNGVDPATGVDCIGSTAAALAIAPLLSHSLVKTDRIIVNAASGITGAGKSPKAAMHFPEANQGYYAYGTLAGHRHQPEIGDALDLIRREDTDVLDQPALIGDRRTFIDLLVKIENPRRK